MGTRLCESLSSSELSAIEQRYLNCLRSELSLDWMTLFGKIISSTSLTGELLPVVQLKLFQCMTFSLSCHAFYLLNFLALLCVCMCVCVCVCVCHLYNLHVRGVVVLTRSLSFAFCCQYKRLTDRVWSNRSRPSGKCACSSRVSASSFCRVHRRVC
jgi:hypothetical protein